MAPKKPSRPFFKPPTPGCAVVAHLREPREKLWGVLLGMDGSGAWLRGIDLGSFEDWARQEASRQETGIGLSTIFVPFLRVEKLVLDEGVGGAPSLSKRFEAIAGFPASRSAGPREGGDV
ncbi:MAG: hypothetical protein JHC34_03390 [Acidobacteria bacterium]|nr:hypothetical protein [Acidobacteriota bacterium]